MKAASSPAHSQACNGMLPWRNRQRVRLLTERSVVRTHPGAYLLQATEMLYFGQKMDAARAKEVGFVGQVFL